jgi:membrane protease subunit HflC
MKRAVNLIVAGAILLALLGYMITFTVRFNEAAIVTTFGKADESSVYNAPSSETGAPGGEAGLHFKWPWPISQVSRKYDTRLQVTDNTLEQAQLADSQTIVVNTYVTWRISDPLKFYKRVGSRAAALDALNLRIQNARSLFGKYTFDDLTNADPSKLKLDQLEQEMMALVQADLAELDNGISVEDVGIKRLMLPASVSAVVAERMRSERSRMAAEFTVQGEATSQTLQDTARSQQSLIESFARATAADIEAEGRTRAEEIMARFAENEEFAVYLLQLRALEETLSKKSTFVIDTSMPPFDLLQGLRQQQSMPLGGSPSAGGQEAGPTASE